MDGMLSQDEINALLNGVDLSADSGSDAGADTATATMTGEDRCGKRRDRRSSKHQYGHFGYNALFTGK